MLSTYSPVPMSSMRWYCSWSDAYRSKCEKPKPARRARQPSAAPEGHAVVVASASMFCRPSRHRCPPRGSPS